MDMYQHDSATMFQFVLRGDLIGIECRTWSTLGPAKVQ
jgi:hypothetical protein